MDAPWPKLTYEEVRAALEAGQKVHRQGRIYLVRRVPRVEEEGPVLWVTDERTPGDRGLLFFPSGGIEAVSFERDDPWARSAT